ELLRRAPGRPGPRGVGGAGMSLIAEGIPTVIQQMQQIAPWYMGEFVNEVRVAQELIMTAPIVQQGGGSIDRWAIDAQLVDFTGESPTCTCAWFAELPDHVCPHIVAVLVWIRVEQGIAEFIAREEQQSDADYDRLETLPEANSAVYEAAPQFAEVV